MRSPDAGSVRERRVLSVTQETSWPREDRVAVEEPLELRIQGRNVAVTMRTPGSDRELALGFAFTEGLVTSAEQVRAVHCGEQSVTVELAPGVEVDLERLRRHSYVSSSCGVCGKGSIEAVRAALPGATGLATAVPPRVVATEVLLGLPATLRQAQAAFDSTGGLHASALFDLEGGLVDVREDVGRHNALDKLVGAALQRGEVPLRDRVVLVSGRASFELVQKAGLAGAPILAAVGAPSSLAVELAEELGMTLLGFLREGRFNVYAGEHRVGSRLG